MERMKSFFRVWRRPRFPWSILLIAGLGAAFRLVNIATEPFWGDELLSLDVVLQFKRVSEIIEYIGAVEFHPPLYYVLLHYWTAWFGAGEGAVRALSLLFSVATIFLTWKFCLRLFQSEKVALLAALLVAVLPIQIEYGQEARPYAIFVFFGLLAIWSAWEFRQKASWRWLVLYVLSALIALYLHYSALFIIAAGASWWFFNLLFEKNKKRGTAVLSWLVAQALVFLGFFPWLKFLLYKILLGGQGIFVDSRNAYFVREPDFLWQVIDQLLWLTKMEHIHPASIAAKAVFVGIFIYFLGKHRVALFAFFHPEQRRYLGLLLWLFAVPLFLFLFSPQSADYTTIGERHVLFASIPLAMALAYVFSRWPQKHLLVGLSIFLVSLVPFVTDVLADDSLWDPDHRLKEAAQFINAQKQPGDLVIVSVVILRSDFAHYLDEEIEMATLMPIGYFGYDLYRTRRTLGLIENEYQVRLRSADPQEVAQQLSRLEQRYQPKRIWLYAVKGDDYKVRSWFEQKGWRHAFQSLGPLFPVDLYVKPAL